MNPTLKLYQQQHGYLPAHTKALVCENKMPSESFSPPPPRSLRALKTRKSPLKGFTVILREPSGGEATLGKWFNETLRADHPCTDYALIKFPSSASQWEESRGPFPPDCWKLVSSPSFAQQGEAPSPLLQIMTFLVGTIPHGEPQ